MYSDRTLLGQSKSGSVYRSVHPTTGQPVLLKILPWDGSAPSPVDASAMLQFAPQFMQVGQAGGFNIARLLDVQQLDEGLALASEYFQAPTISQYPNKGKIGGKEALDVANQLVSALVEGERLRLIHGDIKPSNVLIGAMADGRPHVKLTDWGLNQARPEHPVETLLFTAPERLDGSGPTLRADLFSVGSVLFFLCTGMTLVKGRNQSEIAAAWKTASPDHLKKIRKDLPAKLVKFILSLLEMKPEKRPANPSAALAMLAEMSPPALPQPAKPAPAAGRPAPGPGNARPGAAPAPVAGRPGAPVGARPPGARPGVPVAAPLAPPVATPAPVPVAVPVVAVQGPMRPPTTAVPVGTGRVPATANPDTGTVQVVAMRPPPEIAAKLNLPAYQPEPMQEVMPAPPVVAYPQTPAYQPPAYQPQVAQPVPIAYPVAMAGSHTQPFVTGGNQAIPAGVRTQPMANNQVVGHAQRSAVAGQQRHPGMQQPPAKSKGPLFLVLTLLVLISMGLSSFFIWKNWDKLTKKEETNKEEVLTTSELAAKLRAAKEKQNENNKK